MNILENELKSKIDQLSNHIDIFDFNSKLSDFDISEINANDSMINDFDFIYDYQFRNHNH